jgi:hypothetical protein
VPLTKKLIYSPIKYEKTCAKRDKLIIFNTLKL